MTSRSRSLKFLRKPAAIAAVAAAGMLFLPGTAHAASIAGYVGQSCDGASTVGTFVLAATYDQIEFVQLTVSQNGSVVYDTGKVDISAAPLDDPNTLNVIEGGVTRSTVLAPGDYTYTWVDYWKDGGGPFGADVHGNTPFTVTAGQCTAPTTTTTTTTTAAPTTTTQATTTTAVVNPPTTEVTTTTAVVNPPTTQATTTTAAPTTSVVVQPPTTVTPTTSVAPTTTVSVSANTLPATGSNSGGFLAAGLAFLVLGGGALAGSRRRPASV